MTIKIGQYVEPIDKNEVNEFIENPPKNYVLRENMNDKFAERISFIVHKIAEISERKITTPFWEQNIEKILETGRVNVEYKEHKNGEYLDKEITLYEKSFPVNFLFSDEFIEQAEWELDEWKDNVNMSVSNKI